MSPGKHIHCWLIPRHRTEHPGSDERAKNCVKCCWCLQPRARGGDPKRTALPEDET